MAAGEAVIAGLEMAVRRSTPFIMFAASGGARMQEGILALMQLPRTTVAVQMLREAKKPYIVVLTNPTTGGVTASYAMLGDGQCFEDFGRASFEARSLRSLAPQDDESKTSRAMTPIDSIVARLTALHPKRIDLSLDRVQRLLAALGSPERKLPPVIHVAGTNGKGSTIAFMREILEAAGQRVHVYTSPPHVSVNERFRLGAVGEGRLVSDDELVAALEECERANAGEPITVFEITTAVGLL